MISSMHDKAVSQPSEPETPLLTVENLKVYFPVSRGFIFQRSAGNVKAVDGISFTLMPGKTLGLVGESGSGKTTTGRAILQLTKPTSGKVVLEGRDLTTLNGGEIRRMRRRMGMVFQDPYGALNPRMSAGDIVGEPLVVHGLFKDKNDYHQQVSELLRTVGLNASMAGRYPHEFSGGQRQRLGVARALAAKPGLLVLDEPVSALDVSIQAQVINLLQDLQDQYNLAYIFIAHDLSVVRHISDVISVMYLGKIVEIASREDLYNRPQHPYTQALLSAVPIPDPALERKRERIVLKGDIPSPLNPPSGCVFHTRCPIATDECKVIVPELRETSAGHSVACIKV